MEQLKVHFPSNGFFPQLGINLRNVESMTVSIITCKISDVPLLLQIPNLNLRIAGAGAENQPVRMEHGRRERHVGRVLDLGEQAARAYVREGPVLVLRAGEGVVPGGVQRQPRHGPLVAP